LDQETYFTKGHIWAKGMLFQGAIGYLWYVSEGQRLDELEMERKMNFWVREELASMLDKESILIQKALNRLAGGFCGGVMHLCYKGQFFSSSNVIKKGIAVLEQGKGMYASKSLENMFTEYGMEEIRKELLQNSVEQVANEWKVRMLRSMMQERLEGGYLFVCEDNLHVV
jgi:hypothetical protein